MTMLHTITLRVKRTVQNPRRMTALAILLPLLFMLYTAITLQTLGNASIVSYGDSPENWTTIEPIDDILCPGETMQYTVTISVDTAPAFVDIRESWCIADKQCPRAFKLPPDFGISGKSLSLSEIPGRRDVPDLPPGEWEFRHINITEVNEGHTTLSGYSIYISVPNNCAP